MTVENDGVPPTEADAHSPEDLDPPTELLPLEATKHAAAEAAARKAQLDGSINSALPVATAPPPPSAPATASPETAPPPETASAETQVLPLDHQAQSRPTMHGTMEGDLFDGEEPGEQPGERAP